MRQKVFLCNGQGSQLYFMGNELYRDEPLFTHWFDSIDTFYKEYTGTSLVSILYESGKTKADPFHILTETHPALFAVQYALGMTLQEKGVQPDCILGVSLGEFVGAALAGVISLEKALWLVIKQAQFVSTLTPRGGMIAILAAPESYVQSQILQNNSVFAGELSPELYVVSCLSEHISEIRAYLKSSSIAYQVLPVDYGFHSHLVEDAQNPFLSVALDQEYSSPDIPYISAFCTEQLEEYNAEHFWKAVREPMHFIKTIENMEKTGEYSYIDLSPTGTLSGFILRIRSGSTIHKIMTPFAGKSIINLKNTVKNNRLNMNI